MNDRSVLSKVPAVTLGFWIIKILATTLGETGGDSVSMSWLGVTVGDFLDKPVAKGGLEFSRPLSSIILAVVIVVLILLLPQRVGQHHGSAELTES